MYRLLLIDTPGAAVDYGCKVSRKVGAIQFAVVYAKIAWLHGHQVQVSSPYVPKEWLPIAPLPKYEEAFAFMTESDDSMPVPST